MSKMKNLCDDCGIRNMCYNHPFPHSECDDFIRRIHVSELYTTFYAMDSTKQIEFYEAMLLEGGVINNG